MGRRARGGRDHRPGARRRAAGDDHRQRRHGESRRVLPHDGEESDSRAEHRHRESHSDDLPGRFGGRLSAAAGRRLSRHRRLRPRLPQQRRDERHGHSADRRHHGHVRRRRRLPAGDVRPRADDRRQRTVSRRAGAGAGGHRPESFRRGTGRRRRCTRRSAARSISASRTTKRASRAFARWWSKMGHPPPRAVRSQEAEPPALSGRGNLRHLLVRSRRGSTTCARSSRASWTAAASTSTSAEYGKTLLCGYARIGGFAVGIVANQKMHVQHDRRSHGPASASSSAA